jgi:hypothetical protein
VGGYAEGVLGCTTDAGQITIITGWNFYAGSEAAQIGPGQYDFETVVTHELGHALGLGHSADADSVMYPILATGVARRALVTADLNVPDIDEGPCGLHAAPPPAGHSTPVVSTPAGEGLFGGGIQLPAPANVLPTAATEVPHQLARGGTLGAGQDVVFAALARLLPAGNTVPWTPPAALQATGTESRSALSDALLSPGAFCAASGPGSLSRAEEPLALAARDRLFAAGADMRLEDGLADPADAGFGPDVGALRGLVSGR